MQWECSEREAILACPCGMPAGMLYARDKRAGTFVVSGKILVGCQMSIDRVDRLWESRQTLMRQTDRQGRSANCSSFLGQCLRHWCTQYAYSWQLSWIPKVWVYKHPRYQYLWVGSNEALAPPQFHISVDHPLWQKRYQWHGCQDQECWDVQWGISGEWKVCFLRTIGDSKASVSSCLHLAVPLPGVALGERNMRMMWYAIIGTSPWDLEGGQSRAWSWSLSASPYFVLWMHQLLINVLDWLLGVEPGAFIFFLYLYLSLCRLLCFSCTLLFLFFFLLRLLCALFPYFSFTSSVVGEGDKPCDVGGGQAFILLQLCNFSKEGSNAPPCPN